MKKFIKTIMILIVSLALSISTPITTAYHSYAQQLNKKPIKYVETYTNPMYKGLNVKTYSQGSGLSKANSNQQVPVFDSIEDAGQYLKEEMVKRSGEITFGIKKDYYKNLSKDIFNIAVEDDGYTSSSEGDYLYANWNGYSGEASYTSGYLQITYYMKYLSTYSQEQAVDREVKKVLDELDVYNKGDYIKVKAVHDYIVENIKYDYSYKNHSGYNAIVDKKVVCQGFTSITCKMLKELGIGVRYIRGTSDSGGNHAWNIIKLDDYYWYNSDNTWDACYTDGYGSIDYTWFLKGSSEFKRHFRKSPYNTSEFNSKFPTSYKSYAYEGEHPVINGAEDKTIKVGESFDERAGVTAYDEEDGNLTNKIVINGSVNTNKAGEYTLTYKVTDSDGNTTTATRKITVKSNEKPVINGAEDKTIKVGENFDAREGVTAYDEEDGNLINKIVINGSVNTNKAGKYTLTYQVTDNDRNTTKVKRIITVKSNTFKVFTVNSVKTTSTSISGKGLKGAKVKAYVNGKQIGKTVTVNSSGNYKITIPKQIGGKKIVLKMSKSGYITKEISTIVLKIFPSFKINSVKTTSTSISGKGLKGAKVKAYVNGKQIGKTVTVNSSGNYKITIPKQKKGKKITVQMSKSGYSTVKKSTIVK